MRMRVRMRWLILWICRAEG